VLRFQGEGRPGARTFHAWPENTVGDAVYADDTRPRAAPKARGPLTI
jgi:hypothetical protein